MSAYVEHRERLAIALPVFGLGRAFEVVLQLQLRDQIVICSELIWGRQDCRDRRSNSPLANWWCGHNDCLVKGTGSCGA